MKTAGLNISWSSIIQRTENLEEQGWEDQQGSRKEECKGQSNTVVHWYQNIQCKVEIRKIMWLVDHKTIINHCILCFLKCVSSVVFTVKTHYK